MVDLCENNLGQRCIGLPCYTYSYLWQTVMNLIIDQALVSLAQ